MVNDTLDRFKKKNLLSKEVSSTRQPRKENRSRKSDNILSTYFDTKQYNFLTQSFTFKSKAVLWEQNAAPTYIYPQIQQLSALY